MNLILIVIGVLSLLVLVGAFFASKYWHWAHVTLLVLLYFSGVGYSILAARSLDVRITYQERHKKAVDNLEIQEDNYNALIYGSRDGQIISRLSNQITIDPEEEETFKGLRDLQFRLTLMNRERGRVWRNAVPVGQIDPTTNQLQVDFPVVAPPVDPDTGEATEKPADSGNLTLSADAIVFVFEQGNFANENKKYIGDFHVLQVSGRQATFKWLGNSEVDPDAFARVAASQGPWIIYESMPMDRYDLFEEFAEEELRQILPESSVEEYLRHNTPKQDDDDPMRLVGVTENGNLPNEGEEIVSEHYYRMLRAYDDIFMSYKKENTELIALIKGSTLDLQKLDAALEGAKKLQAHREEERSMLENDLEMIVKERKAMEDHLNSLQSQIAKAERLLSETLAMNAKLATELTRSQAPLKPVTSPALDIDAL